MFQYGSRRQIQTNRSFTNPAIRHDGWAGGVMENAGLVIEPRDAAIYRKPRHAINFINFPSGEIQFRRLARLVAATRAVRIL